MTRAEAAAQLAAWTAASLALAKAQSYTIGEQTVTRQDGAEVRAQIAHWQRVINDFDAVTLGASLAPGFSLAKDL